MIGVSVIYRSKHFVLRQLIVLTVLIEPGFCSAVNSYSCPSIGAIRWDAWHGDKGPVGKEVEASLNPSEFRSRIPFCSTNTSDNKLSIDCSTTETMEEEINFAVEGGIDYWAFLTYPKGNAMGLALENYLTSKNNHLIDFSIIITAASLTQPMGTLDQNIERFALYAKLPQFQKVLNNRPLMFFLLDGNFYRDMSNIQWLATSVSKLKTTVKKMTGNEPYLVLMDFNPTRGRNIADSTGFDAISTYATHGDEKSAPYLKLATSTVAFWEKSKNTGAKVVPTAMAGWDRRPRVLHTMPWEKGQPKRPDEISYFYEAPTPVELATHVVEAMKWIVQNPNTAEANSLLIYAWNENDEGGWLIPTYGEKAVRLVELGRSKNRFCKK